MGSLTALLKRVSRSRARKSMLCRNTASAVVRLCFASAWPWSLIESFTIHKVIVGSSTSAASTGISTLNWKLNRIFAGRAVMRSVVRQFRQAESEVDAHLPLRRHHDFLHLAWESFVPSPELVGPGGDILDRVGP